MWIGIDDTDSVTGGCTTYLANAIVKKLTNEGYKIIGHPRLVRLNPNIPWKTRGNGAVSIEVNNDNSEIIKKKIEELFNRYAKLDDRHTNPGFVILDKQPSFDIYEKAVKGIVTIKETEKLLESLGAIYKGYKNKRGLIGATASIAWSTKNDKTYELIAYRYEYKWGTKRKVDTESVKKMNEIFSSTFDNYDYENNHNRLTPSSPCPVLFGIRGEKIDDLMKASSVIISERVDSWIIFETNQGTDDHLQRKKISEIQPYQSVIVQGTVVSNPQTLKGGHVIFTIKDSTGKIDCAAYEPTKQFRNFIRELIIGDKLEVYGGIRKKPLTINIEKINIKYLKKLEEKVENPICPKCNKHMKSKGTGQGFKCKKCGIKSNKPFVKKIKRNIDIGFYEVPICARRHLSKPLKRMKP
ncbi:DNA-binding protein [Thermoplasmatales archaeon SG8-52-4]|nr:MAG: DNA-binding protein [Thermoplasmatales archaeon SG8-52-4]